MNTVYQPYADIPGQCNLLHASDPSKPWLAGANVLADLAEVMTTNSSMRLLVLSGCFDLATPYLVDSFEMKHLPMARQLQKSIDYGIFQTGHDPILTPMCARKCMDR